MTPRHVQRAFKTSFALLISYIALAISILILSEFYLHQIAMVRDDEGQVLPLIKANFTTFSQNLNNNDITSTITLALFWGVIGTLVYFLVMFIGHFAASTQHLITEELTYVKPDTHAIHKEYAYTVIRIIARIGVLISLLFVIIASIEFVFPLAVQAFDVFVSNWRTSSSLLNGALSVASLTGAMYVAISCLRLLASDRSLD